MELKRAKEIVEKKIVEMEGLNDILAEAPCDDDDLKEWNDWIEALRTILKEVQV